MKPVLSYEKVTAEHQSKLAYIYIRQSSLAQVLHNTESTARQYELVERARALGWPAARVEVIDDDQAHSGARSDGRRGFQRLLAQIGLGMVGMVLSLEAARLARNCSDWYRLLELCSIFGTLIADGELVYDPRLYHDRLLLGLAGMMSEAELHHIRMRLHAGQRHKAARGQLRVQLPVGLERLREGEVVLNPDEEIQARLRLVFEKFRELGSAAGVVRYLRACELKLPTRPHRGPEPCPVLWVPAKISGVLNILQNPAYAGVYAWGRSKAEPTRRKADVANSGIVRLPIEQWEVLLEGVYPAYISFEEYKETQQRLRANQYRYWDGKQGAPRTGEALLQGIARCGICGVGMWMRYRGVRNGHPGYVCNETARELGEPRCQEVSSRDVDPEIERLVLGALEPDKIELALAAFEHLERETATLDRHWQLRLERARYETTRAERQYHACEPENRLVGRNLERHWEAKLRAAEELEQEYQRWHSGHSTALSAEDRAEILALAQDVSTVWSAETTTSADRKRIVRLLIKDVQLDRKREVGYVWMRVNWQTGATSEHRIRRQVNRYKELPEAKALEHRLRELKGEGLRDVDIVPILNAEGHKASNGGPITKASIYHLREIWDIESAKQERRRLKTLQWEDGTYTLKGVATAVGVHFTTVHVWIRRGMLETRQAYKGAPVKIVLSPERLEELREYVARVRILPYSKRIPSDQRLLQTHREAL